MQITDFIVQFTGRPFGVLFPGLVELRQGADGTISITRWDASLGTQPTPEEIAAALLAGPSKAQLVAHAADKRWSVETGGVTIAGSRIDTSRDSQSMIAGVYAYITTSGAASVSFKAASGWVTMDAAMVKAVALAVGAHVQAAFAVEQAVDAQIDAGTVTTTAGIDAAPWPPNA